MRSVSINDLFSHTEFPSFFSSLKYVVHAVFLSTILTQNAIIARCKIAVPVPGRRSGIPSALFDTASSSVQDFPLKV